MIEVRWSDQARTDIDDLLDFYEGVDADLADRIDRAIIAAPTVLSEHPRAGQIVGALGLRKWPVRKLPLLLLYRVVDNHIEVDRVVHQRQNWRPD